MAEGSFQKMVVGSLLVGLFTVLLFTFIISVSNDYGVETNVEQTGIDLSALNQTMDNIKENVDNLKEDFESQNIFSIVAGIVVTGIFQLGLNMMAFVVNIFNLIFVQVLNNVLGIPVIVSSIIASILIISMIFALWRVLKSGD